MLVVMVTAAFRASARPLTTLPITIVITTAAPAAAAGHTASPIEADRGRFADPTVTRRNHNFRLVGDAKGGNREGHGPVPLPDGDG